MAHDRPAKTRFAPSPTGRLHLGNVRTALFNVLLARRLGGQFLLRVEDTDAERSREEFVAAQCADLEWLGLHWHEGPGRAGEHGPYRQSERSAIYRNYFAALEHRGLAYPCFCSELELKMVRKAQLAAGQPPRYPGTCANLSATEVEHRLAEGIRPTLRFRVPKGQRIAFEDTVRGTQRYLSDEIGDFIIRRADGTSAFFFCNAVDDALMGVTHVLRGEDHLTNTPRQLMLLEALDLPAPSYGHITTIVGGDGKPLSKRHGALSLKELREQGYRPEALINHLARLGHYYSDDALMTLDELAQRFEFAHLGRAPARHDETQLMHWQREAVARLDTKALLAWAGPALPDVPSEDRERLLVLVAPNIRFPIDATEWAAYLLGSEHPIEDDAGEILATADAELFASAASAVRANAPDYQALIAQLKAQGYSGKRLFKPLRAALTGRLHGPELDQIYAFLGAQRAGARLERAAALARDLSSSS